MSDNQWEPPPANKTDARKMTRFPRPLTHEERALVRWMLQHGEPGTETFLQQLDEAVVSGGCGCGCASIDFQIADRHPDRQHGMTILSDYPFEPESPPFGAFVFAYGDTLGGLDVSGFGATADRLPTPEELRPAPKTKCEPGSSHNSNINPVIDTLPRS